MYNVHVCAASVIFIETVFGVRESPIIVESCVCIIVHGVSTITMTTCEPYM